MDGDPYLRHRMPIYISDDAFTAAPVLVANSQGAESRIFLLLVQSYDYVSQQLLEPFTMSPNSRPRWSDGVVVASPWHKPNT